MQKTKMTNQMKRNDKALLQGEARSAMDCQYNRVQWGLQCPTYLSQQEQQRGQQKMAQEIERCSFPTARKGISLLVLMSSKIWLQDMQVCSANMGALRDLRATVISCWLFGKKVPILLTVCSLGPQK